MASSDVQRKLTAILCTDVVGYFRLMGDADFAKRFLDPDPPAKLTGRSIITLTDV